MERAYPKIELQLELVLGRTWHLVPAEGRDRADPAHRAGRLVAGRAFGDRHAREVIVARGLFQRLGGEWTERGPVPSSLEMRAARRAGGVDQEALLALRVVGLIEPHRGPDRIEIPLGLAQGLDRWFEGGHAPGLPEPPVPVLEEPAPGSVRATLFARDADAVALLVAHVRRTHGYQTVDSLEQQRSLRELGRALTTLVLLLVAGSVLVGTVAIVGTHAQKVQAHVREIALLRAMG